jgi:hypothetical protein
VDSCARIAAAELGWNDARVSEEVASIRRFYEIKES